MMPVALFSLLIVTEDRNAQIIFNSIQYLFSRLAGNKANNPID
jgi:hypothetical protein